MRVKIAKFPHWPSKDLLFLSLVLLIGAALRFYNLQQGMPYMGDEGRDAQIAKDIITGAHFPLVGPPTSVGSIYLGPLFFYMMAPFLGLFNFDPLGGAVFVALTSLATIFLIYVLGLEIFQNRTTALISAFFYAVSPVVVEFGRWPWNPNVMPFFVTVFILSLWMVLARRREKWLLVAAASLAFVLQSHYMGLAAIPVLAAAFLFKRPRLTKYKYWLLSLGLFVFLMSPLLVFDLRHDFLNSKGFLAIVSERSEGGFSLYDWLSRARDRTRQIFGDFTGFGERSLVNNTMLALGLIAWFFLERKKSRWWLLWIWLILGVLFMGLYQGPFYLHYLEFLLPVCALFLGGILGRLLGVQRIRHVSLVLIVILSFFFLNKSITKATDTRIPNVLTTKEIVRFIARESEGKSFNFSLLAESNYDSAYRYFLNLWKIPAEYNQVTQQLFVVCEGDKLCRPEGNAKWEIAVFDAAYNGKIKKVDQWQFYNYITVMRFLPEKIE